MRGVREALERSGGAMADPLEEWLDAFAGDLATKAQTSEQAQLALLRMLAS
jgi:hypothetical protein